MRRFTTVCIDNETGMEMILWGCTYNEACMFLEVENSDHRFGNLIETESVSMYETKIIYERAEFLYDEERGILMRGVDSQCRVSW